MINGLDEFLTIEPDYCDLDEYDPRCCDGCWEAADCEVYAGRPDGEVNHND